MPSGNGNFRDRPAGNRANGWPGTLISYLLNFFLNPLAQNSAPRLLFGASLSFIPMGLRENSFPTNFSEEVEQQSIFPTEEKGRRLKGASLG